MIWSNFVNYIKITKCFSFGHRRVEHIKLWKMSFRWPMSRVVIFPQQSFSPTHKSIPHHLLSLSFCISRIALAPSIRIFRQIKTVLLLNSLVTAASLSVHVCATSVCGKDGGFGCILLRSKVPRGWAMETVPGRWWRWLWLLGSLVIKFFPESIRRSRQLCSKNKQYCLTLMVSWFNMESSSGFYFS